MNQRALYVGPVLVAVGLMFAYLFQIRFDAEVRGTRVPIVVAATDVSLGTVLQENHLALEEIPESFLEPRHVRGADLSNLVGVPLTMSLHAGEPVMRSDLAQFTEDGRPVSASIPPGMRAVTIDSGGSPFFGGLLRPGDRVDLLVTVAHLGEEEKAFTVPVLENLLVLGVGTHVRSSTPGAADPSTGARARVSHQATVAATPQQAQRIAQAKTAGTLTALLRSPDDIAVTNARTRVQSPDVIDANARVAYLRRANP